MSYEERVSELATTIAPHVLFDNVDQAREYSLSYKQPECSEVPQAILHMAEEFITYAGRFGIEKFIEKGRAHRTHVSMLCEAIRLCASREVVRYELEELAEIGAIARTPMSVSA